jgi:hypothetical protein
VHVDGRLKRRISFTRELKAISEMHRRRDVLISYSSATCALRRAYFSSSCWLKILSWPGCILLPAYQSAFEYRDIAALILMTKSGELVTRVFGPTRAMGPVVNVNAGRPSMSYSMHTITGADFCKNSTLINTKNRFRKPEVCPSC